jgi:L-ribulokinase
VSVTSVTGATVGYVVGVDFGTLSGRAVVVRVSDGFELASAVHPYSSGVLDATLPDGTPLPPEWALQDPADYLEVLRVAVPGAIAASGIDPGDVVGIGCDFTACTVLPTLADGTPLCDLPEWRSHPHAWVKLWKHHAAQPEADVVNAVAGERGEPWLPRYGSRISSEWLFPKLLQILHEAPEVYRAAERFVEAADWIIWQLTGAETRNACTAGYKAIHQDGRFPTDEYLAALHPEFGDAVDRLMLTDLASLGDCAGHLCEKAAGWTGLRAGIAVAVGNVDAHVTAPAAGAVGPGELVAIMGTSTCHVLNGTALREVPGMCGVVDGGIVPGLYGYEAGQSGVGDIFGWFVDHAVPPEFHREASIAGIGLHELLTREAARQVPGAHGLLALDWWNGNRSVLVDANVSGLVVGATLATRAPDIYRSLLEATAFGTRVIVENFVDHGVDVDQIVLAGGLTKNRLLLQIYADVLDRPLDIVSSDHAPALGSAMHAAVAAGCYPDITAAAERMGRRQRQAVMPNPAAVAVYDKLFTEYVRLHDLFGRGADDVMRTLRHIAHDARASAAGSRAAG